ncbi:carboxymuconolactone decarboxylase family protein [Methylococcus sp. EFPC2]|uniref:carboxymuconolactone decarboxylase family protein n=1 Tax=Methylococcus sp. EFPC2 TaxID=2812648 RepID=UPI00196758D5|nr:carboxymuconolactone decarboxylase family protein [Methylococcus sp. EFPC2]QSA96326.1 carboxymuconolactone decarboxylase family protein [Methylococcus sp. EFPC2]
MSFVDTPDDYPYAWYVRPVLALLRKRLGGVPEPVKLWARMPLAFLGFQLMQRALERKASPLDGKLRALVRTRIAQLNSCHFCVDLNASHALERGVTEEQLRDLAIFRDSPRFAAAEKAALVYAEAVSGEAIAIEPELIERLRQAYGDQGIVELAALVGHQNLSAKFNAALGVPAEGYCMTAYGIAPPD